MNKIIKTTLSIVAVATLVGMSFAPAVSAWGDNSGGRKSYTKKEIENGALGTKAVLNSISDGVIGDEKNFVGAREDAPNVKYVEGNDITVSEGKTYIVRLYVHNNSPEGKNVIAKDVTTQLSIDGQTAKKVQINGFIKSSNATPSEYWDYVNFNSDRNFRLEYIEGSALLENNGIGKNGGIKLSDNLVKTTEGVKIGYDALDGNIPGCFQYASYVSIKVKPVFESSSEFKVEKTVRRVGEKTWQEKIEGLKVGDKVEYQIHFKNTTGKSVENVMVKDVMPANMKYINGTLKLYNATNPKGIVASNDADLINGLNIGGYAQDGDGYVRFTAEVIDKSLVCGTTKVVNWGQVGVGTKTLQDSAEVYVDKTCAETPKTPEQPVDTIPATGPASIIAGVVGSGAIATSLGYYIVSRRKLQ